MPTANDLGREFSIPLRGIAPAITSLVEGWSGFHDLQQEVLKRFASGDRPDEADAPVFVMHHLERWEREQRSQKAGTELADWKPRSEWAMRLFNAAKCLLDLRDVAGYALARTELCRDFLANGVFHVKVTPFDSLRNGLLLVRSSMEWRSIGLTMEGFLDDGISEVSPHIAPTVAELKALSHGLGDATWPSPAPLVADPAAWQYPRIRALFMTVGDCLIDAGLLADALAECQRVVGITDIAGKLAAHYQPVCLSRSRAMELLRHREYRWICEKFDEYHVASERFWMARAKLGSAVAQSRTEMERTRDTSGINADHVLKHLSEVGTVIPRPGDTPPLDPFRLEQLRTWTRALDELGEKVRHLAFAKPEVAEVIEVTTCDSGPSATPPQVEETSNRFLQRGAYWDVRFRSADGLVPHSKGMVFIRELIERQGKAVSSWDLEAMLPVGYSGRSASSQQTIDDEMGQSDDAERIDPEAAREVRDCLKQAMLELESLRAEIESLKAKGDPRADLVERVDLPEQLGKVRQLESYLGLTRGLDGPARLSGSNDAARSRQRVQKAIAASISSLGRVPGGVLQPLADHLADSIPAAIDGAFVYTPRPPVEWILR